MQTLESALNNRTCRRDNKCLYCLLIVFEFICLTKNGKLALNIFFPVCVIGLLSTSNIMLTILGIAHDVFTEKSVTCHE